MRKRRLAILATATVLLSAAAVSSAGSASAAAGCRVAYTVSSQWPGGFGAAVAVTNLGDPVSGWTLTFSFPAGQTITQLWNGTSSQSGAAVTVRDAGYNAAIPTGGSASFGFNGSWTGTNPAPASFVLNGVTCTGATTSTSTTQPIPSDPVPTVPTTTPGTPTAGAKQMERLNRGLISVRSG